MSEKNSFWNSAAIAGLVLGGISILYMVSGLLLGKIQNPEFGVNMIVSVASFILWAAKFAGCIYLMKFFMQRFFVQNPESDNRQVRRFGRMVALLSAVVFAAFNLAYYLYIDTTSFTESIKLLAETGLYNKAQLSLLEEMAPMMPTYAFFGQLIYCWLFGVVVSSIFARNIPPRNPFAN